MWEVLKKAHGLNESRTCMLGDRLDTDIAFADTNSLASSLAVLTGVANEQQIQKYALQHDKKHLCPEYYADSLGDLYNYIE